MTTEEEYKELWKEISQVSMANGHSRGGLGKKPHGTLKKEYALRKKRGDSEESIRAWFDDSKWSKPAIEDLYDLLWKEIHPIALSNNHISNGSRGGVSTTFRSQFKERKDRGDSVESIRQWFCQSKWSKTKDPYEALWKELLSIVLNNGHVEKSGAVSLAFRTQFKKRRKCNDSVQSIRDCFYQSNWSKPYQISPYDLLWKELYPIAVSNGHTRLKNNSVYNWVYSQFLQRRDRGDSVELIREWFLNSKWNQPSPKLLRERYQNREFFLPHFNKVRQEHNIDLSFFELVTEKDKETELKRIYKAMAAEVDTVFADMVDEMLRGRFRKPVPETERDTVPVAA